MTQSVVQSSAATNFGGAAATVQVTLPDTVAGNRVQVVFFGWGGSVYPDCTVDDGTTTFDSLKADAGATGGLISAEVHWYEDIPGGDMDVNVTHGANTGDWYGWFVAMEVSGGKLTGAHVVACDGVNTFGAGTTDTPYATGSDSTVSGMVVSVLMANVQSPGWTDAGIDAANGGGLTWNNILQKQNNFAEAAGSADWALIGDGDSPTCNWGTLVQAARCATLVIVFEDASTDIELVVASCTHAHAADSLNFWSFDEAIPPDGVTLTNLSGSYTNITDDPTTPDDSWLTIDEGGGVFPLTLTGTRFIKADGDPFFILADAAWNIEVQLTHAQIDAYLDDRQAKGFTAIMFEMIEHYFSSQTPAYRNAQSSVDPFTVMSPVNWVPNETYWRTVDYIIEGARSRGMLCIIFPAYWGYEGTTEGWSGEFLIAGDVDLQNYGEFLGERYRQPNILWCMGGDNPGANDTARLKQWNIVEGILSTAYSAHITAHPWRTQVSGESIWGAFNGFNVNCNYIQSTNIADVASLAARAVGLPYFTIEGGYENEGSVTAASIRMGAYTSVLCGASGYGFGSNPVWGFGEPNACGGTGAAAVLASNLNSASANDMADFAAFFLAYEWWRLVPKHDASLVTTSLGTAGTTGRICPALADDGSFAMIWVPATNASLTVAMDQLTPSSVRARWFDPSDGSYAAVGGSPFSNSGTQSFTAAGDRVLVLDAQP